MDMELSIGDFSDHSQILRGKRSKRKRPSASPPFNCALAVTSSYSSGSAGGDTSFSTQYSPAASTDVSAPNEEELEEMASCLIMLAESLSNKSNHHDYSEKVISRRLTDTATAGNSSCAVYECKTCNRTFPSFQALGGHRASHTKPNKVVPVSPPPEEIETKALILPKLLTEKVNEPTGHQAKVNSAITVHQVPPLSILIGSGNSTRATSKVHQCSICGAEFSSGQALGGHMRRHRIPPAPIKTTTTAAMSPSSPLSPKMVTTTTTTSGDQTETSEENGGSGRGGMMMLDLNLPAPEYDEEADTFPAMVFDHQY